MESPALANLEESTDALRRVRRRQLSFGRPQIVAYLSKSTMTSPISTALIRRVLPGTCLLPTTNGTAEVDEVGDIHRRKTFEFVERVVNSAADSEPDQTDGIGRQAISLVVRFEVLDLFQQPWTTLREFPRLSSAASPSRPQTRACGSRQ
jgi:hypothetical protein